MYQDIETGSTVRLRANRVHWGTVWGVGMINQGDGWPQHEVARVAWANDAVLSVPHELQYVEDLEEFDPLHTREGEE